MPHSYGDRTMVLNTKMTKCEKVIIQKLHTGIITFHLTHWGRVTYICVSKQTIIGSDNSLSPGQRQAIICTNAGILLIGPLGTNLSEILIEIWKCPQEIGSHLVSASMCYWYLLALSTLNALTHNWVALKFHCCIDFYAGNFIDLAWLLWKPLPWA